MAVLHYKNNDGILCGTKSKTYKYTDDKTLVTCKRCLNKLKSNKIRVNKDKDYVTLTVKKAEMRFNNRGKIDNFMFITPHGSIFTSCGLHGTQVKRAMSVKDRKEISTILKSLQINNDGLFAEDIYNEFKI